MKKVAVILAGCGVYDGSEIHEAVLALLCLEQAGATYQCFAPDVLQMHVVNHLTGEVNESEQRNVLVESARIARGNVKPLSAANVDDFDALFIPGGFGAAKNLSDFALKGADLTVQGEVLAFARAMHQANKAIGLVCIAPVMSAAILGEGVQCTIGNDKETAAAINATGAEHVNCEVTDSVVDHQRKLVTSPAYMLATSVSEVYQSIHSCIKHLLAIS